MGTMIELPRVEGGFGCIVSDPPWEFSNKATRASASDHYEEMSRRDIECMRVEQVAAENAHLYLWCTDTHLAQAWILAGLWGFQPKMTLSWVETKEIETKVWRELGGSIKVAHLHGPPRNEHFHDLKLQIGMGNYFRHCHEMVLFCTRGKAPGRVKNFPSVFFAERGEHSAKPEILQDLAEHMSNGPGLELFACRQRPHWTCWGPKAHRGELVTFGMSDGEIREAERKQVEIIGSDDNGVPIHNGVSQ
jgi:N6-adenosine-specific RNA methylase IME4